MHCYMCMYRFMCICKDVHVICTSDTTHDHIRYIFVIYDHKTSHKLIFDCVHIYAYTVKVVPQDQADKIKAPSRRSRSLQRQDQKGPWQLPAHRTNSYILFKQPFRSSPEGDPNNTRAEHPQDQEASLLKVWLSLLSAATACMYAHGGVFFICVGQNRTKAIPREKGRCSFTDQLID